MKNQYHVKKNISLIEHQKIMLNILNIFADYCEEHHLRYYLDAGTLLGAVRHGGFIPWDNDMDVGMPRKDYDKLMELMARQNDHMNDYIILERPEDTIYQFLKIGDARTKLIEFSEKNPIECYIYIDVFPKDGIHKLCGKTKMLCKITEILALFHWFNKYSIPCWKSKKIGLKKIIAVLADIVTIDYNWAYKMQQRIIRRYSKKHPFEACKYATTLVNGEYHACAPKNCFTEVIDWSFAGCTFKIPADYDKYLRILYHDDYMMLPPPDKRVIHEVETYWR